MNDRASENTDHRWRRGFVTFDAPDDDNIVLEGWIRSDENWNGYAMPAFSLEECHRLRAHLMDRPDTDQWLGEEKLYWDEAQGMWILDTYQDGKIIHKEEIGPFVINGETVYSFADLGWTWMETEESGRFKSRGKMIRVTLK